MNTHTRLFRPARLHAALLLALFAPGLLLAQDEFSLDEPTAATADPDAIAELTEIRSWIEFGLGYLDDDSRRFGRFSGLDEEGGYGVLNIDWYQRAAWDSGDARYTRLTARNLGFDSRQLRAEHGVQGRYVLRLDYAELPMRRESGFTPFAGVGGTQLTLPAGWVPGTGTAAMTQLLPSLGAVDIGNERRRFGLGFGHLLSRHWEIETSVRHERKDGLKTFGAVIGNSGGNPRAVLLPEPIDYETREADIALRYTSGNRQLEFRYLVSLFENANPALSWQNPYATINGWHASVGYPNGFGQVALPPDNQFHQASVLGGISWGSYRLTADFALGRMTQDEAFLPYTINPVLADSIEQPLPRSSLDGEIDTTVANIRFSARPTPRLFWNVSLRYDDRDNDTPRDEYVYVPGDSQTQDIRETSSRRRFNEPYSFRETRLRLDGGYRFGHRTHLSAALERRDTERTLTEREQVDEDVATLQLRHATSDWLAASLRVSRADRSGSTYHGDEPFLSSYAPGYTSTVAGAWENHPDLRKFHLADRIRDRVGLNLTLTPNQHWSIAFDAQRVDDDYRRSEMGLTANDSDIYTIDLGFVPNPQWHGYLFFAHEDRKLDQDGRAFRGGSSRLGMAADPANDWRALHREDVDTAGIGFKWKPQERKFELGGDYTYAKSRTQIDVIGGSAVNAEPLPTDRTRLASYSLHGSYRLRSDLSLNLRLWHERYRSTDFALDGVAVNQLANVILLGEQAPNYEVNFVMLSMSYRF